jgi:hypothetical protein
MPKYVCGETRRQVSRLKIIQSRQNDKKTDRYESDS